MTDRAQHAPGPWRLGVYYGIFKGDRRVLEGDGSTTIAERQSIADSLNRDYADENTVLGLLAACERADRLISEARRLPAPWKFQEERLREAQRILCEAIAKARGGQS